MKKIFKNPIFAFILGVIITGSIGVVASNILASNITYDNTTSGLKDNNNQDVTTVQGAIDVLYGMANKTFSMDLLWTNPNPSSEFVAQKILIDLSNYSYVSLDCRTELAFDGELNKSLIKVGESGKVLTRTNPSYNMDIILYRDVTTDSTGVTYSIGKWHHDTNFTGTAQCIPYHIWGLNIDTIN